MSATDPTGRERAIVAGLQWGLTQAFVLDGVASLLENYYRATTDEFFAPDWVFSISAAVPVAFVIGAIFGYRWVTSGRGASGSPAHRARVRFTGAVLVGWTLAIVPVLALKWGLGDRLFSVPWFLLPSLVPVPVLAVATYLGYGTDDGWYANHRTRLLGAVQGVFCGLFTGTLAFVGYSWFLQATRDTFAFDGSPLLVGFVTVGGLVGYALADRLDAGDRGPEFVTLLVLSSLTLSIVAGVLRVILSVWYGTTGMLFYPTVPMVLALLMTVYLTYRARTDVYRRLVGRAARHP